MLPRGSIKLFKYYCCKSNNVVYETIQFIPVKIDGIWVKCVIYTDCITKDHYCRTIYNFREAFVEAE